MSNILARTYDAALAVTKDDATNDPAGPFAGLLVAVAGTVKFTDNQGNDVATGSILAGTVLDIATKRVWSTGTTATVYGLRALPYKPTAKAP